MFNRSTSIVEDPVAGDEERLAVAQMGTRRVLFIDEVAARVGCSRKTIERRIKAGTFPILPLPSIDCRLRWSEDDVEAYERGRIRRVS